MKLQFKFYALGLLVLSAIRGLFLCLFLCGHSRHILVYSKCSGGIIIKNGVEDIISYGLNESEVALSRKTYGDNKMTPKKRVSFMRRFLSNLSDPVIKILLGALVINLIFLFKSRNFAECIGIGVSVFLATLISTLSEHSSEGAFERLESEYAKGSVRVIRGGEMCEIPIECVVVGDIVCLYAGEQIPADGEMVRGRIKVDQSAMTGESREVTKSEKKSGDDCSPSSPYYCFRGCLVTSGSGYMRVCKVGDSTFLGGISQQVQEDLRESPLKMRLSKLARQISRIGYIAAFLVAGVFLFKTFVIDSSFDLEIIKYKCRNLSFLFANLFSALTLGLTVIVVAVPEGLPMMIAVVLSANIKRMIKDNVLVRKPTGIESAGSMNILFTDKTGTLTCGKLGTGNIYLGSGEVFSSSSELHKKCPEVFYEYCLNGVFNTESRVGNLLGEKGIIGGNFTDRGILGSLWNECPESVTERREKLIDKIPFDSEKKMSLCIVQSENGRSIYIKGAPERLLPYVKKYISAGGEALPFLPSKIKKICESETKSGKRVLLMAKANTSQPLSDIMNKSIPELTFICLIVLEDFLRESARASVERLQSAGVGVVMITGDNRDTATEIAKKCGIFTSERNTVLTSDELAQMTDSRVKEILPHLCVLSRALPTDKSRLVRLSQEMGLVVGMTGDGVNDAPALRASDVGFAMGSGVQVAKDAGDIVILDNNLSSIGKAVLYGRTVFKSIRKFITLQLMMNFCAVAVSMICPFLGINSPVTVVQMLWINIIMDTLGGLAFAGEGALESSMQEKPKRRDEQILNSYMINEIVVLGSFTVALYLTFLKCPYITSLYRYHPKNLYLLTAFFALFIFSSVFNCFNARTDRVKLFSGLSKNKGFILIMSGVLFIQILFIYLGGSVLRTAPLSARELVITFLLSLLVFPVEFLRKLVLRLLKRKKGY